MSAQSNHRNPITLIVPLGSPSADAVVCAGVVHRKSKLIAAYIQNGAAIAASDTNYLIGQLKNGSTVLAALDTRAAAQNGLADKVGKAMVNASSDVEIAAGSSLTFNYDETDAGTNVALTSAVMVVVLEQVGSAGP